MSISDPKGRVDTSEFGCAELQRRKPKKMEFGGSQTPVWACDPKGRVDTLEFGFARLRLVTSAKLWAQAAEAA